MLKDIKIPEISENVTTCKIVSILIKAGDAVAVDDVLLEMETDKAVVELPSPYAGKISEVLIKEGEEKNVGDVIARIEVEAEAEAVAEEKETSPAEIAGKGKEKAGGEEQKEDARPEGKVAAAGDPQTDAVKAAEEKDAGLDGRQAESVERDAPSREESSFTEEDQAGQPPPASPSVRRIARELGVDIRAVSGSGADGRISQADVYAYVKRQLSRKTSLPGGIQGAAAIQPQLPDFSRWGAIRTEKIETVRRLTAESTGLSWRVIPQVTQFDEADITDLQTFMAEQAKGVEKKGGRLTVTAVLMKICAMALARFPRFNASIDQEKGELIYKDYIHIGMAVDTPRGLLVPVIRDVPQKGISDLAVEIVDLARRAREKKVKPGDFEGGTFTISNQGGIGGTGFTPVVSWPQAAILGVSRSRRMLVEKNGDFIPRSILPLCVTYDHRIVDGADAARFLDWICRGLEQPMTMLV